MNSSSDVRTSLLDCFGFKINQEEIRLKDKQKSIPPVLQSWGFTIAFVFLQ